MCRETRGATIEEGTEIMTAQKNQPLSQTQSSAPSTTPSTNQEQASRPEAANLVRRYGQIGIGALTAALQYSTSLKKPSSAPAVTRLDERFVEHAA
jgi:hypothetical protein